MEQDLRNMPHELRTGGATSFKLMTTGVQTPPTRAIYVSVGGTVAWTDLEGNAVTDIVLSAGSLIPVALTSVQSLGSAAIYALR